jgi:hypothetical protein
LGRERKCTGEEKEWREYLWDRPSFFVACPGDVVA